MTIKELIKSSLDNKNMSQKELAMKLGVTEPAVTKWLKSESKPSDSHLSKLCEILELDINTIRAMLDVNYSEELARKMFIDEFLKIDSVEKAARFVEELFLDFEMDACDKITMTYMLKCYAMITLLKTVDDRHMYENDPLCPYDIENYICELREAYDEYVNKRYKEYEYKQFEFELENDIQKAIADMYSTVFEEHYAKIHESGNAYKLEIYVRLLMEHIRRKSYSEYSLADKYSPF